MNILEQIRNRFVDKIGIMEKSAKRVYIAVEKEEARELVCYLFRDLGARFSIATGVDTRPGIEILYHMAFDANDLMLTVRVLVRKPELEMPTFSDFMPAAEWIEREIHEMFGVKFIGHPNLQTLLLPDDWPEGVYPLRKGTFESEKENEEREN
ncbi:MAG: NADH-quinone oxidoreductase subunit C [Candidatus Margulisbacteria bacterium]|nr:NADH-quinone oxidoreductase subunit C [Candidatus Margulisiibacteriota bacterium]